MQRSGNMAAGLATLALLLLASPAETPLGQAKAQPSACKLAVPFLVQIQPGSAPQAWDVQILTRDADRQVYVWMWSGSEAERRLVWRGPLRAGQEQRLTMSFAATGTVWAAVETQGGAESGLRAVASASRTPRTAELAADSGVLLQNPATGETILQYTGQQEGGR